VFNDTLVSSPSFLYLHVALPISFPRIFLGFLPEQERHIMLINKVLFERKVVFPYPQIILLPAFSCCSYIITLRPSLVGWCKLLVFHLLNITSKRALK